MATSRIVPPSSNPYGSGAVLFDTTPFTQYVLNQQAKQQAKDEALDNYFKTIDSKINPAGMRTQEIPVLMQQQNADRQFYQENKDKIKNPSLDNGKTYNEYMQRHQSKMAFIENSKRAAEKYKPIASVLADPTKRSLIPDEFFSDQGALHLHDLPLNDPRHKDIDVASLNFNPKPFDESKYRTALTPYVKEAAAQTSFENNPDYSTSFLRTPKTQMVQNYDKNQIATVAEDKYKNDPSYKKMINDIGNNPTQYAIHNEIYKKAFGKNLDILHPEQIAVAHTLSLLPKDYTKEGKPEIDQVAFQAAKTKESERFRQKLHDESIAEANKRAAIITGSQYNPLTHVEDIKKSGTADNSITLNGKQLDGVAVPSLPPKIEDEYFAKDYKGKIVRPNKIILDNDNMHLVYFDGKTASGNDKVDHDRTKTIPINSSLVPTLDKMFGNPKKNLYPTAPVTKPTKGKLY